MKTQTKYLDFDENGFITRVGCMVCNKTLAQRELHKLTKQFYLKYMSHIRNLPMTMDDGTMAEAMVCPDCLVADHDLEHFERTIHWGWMAEQKAVYTKHKDGAFLKEALARAAALSRTKKILKKG